MKKMLFLLLQWDMLRREAHGGIIQRDGLTDGHTGTGVPR